MTKTTKNLTITIFGLIAGMMLCSCSHSSFGRLVGSDRDEHGCIGSAGYTWSYALHDCIRLWEAGIRFDAGPEQTFVVFSIFRKPPISAFQTKEEQKAVDFKQKQRQRRMGKNTEWHTLREYPRLYLHEKDQMRHSPTLAYQQKYFFFINRNEQRPMPQGRSCCSFVYHQSL